MASTGHPQVSVRIRQPGRAGLEGCFTRSSKDYQIHEDVSDFVSYLSKSHTNFCEFLTLDKFNWRCSMLYSLLLSKILLGRSWLLA